MHPFSSLTGMKDDYSISPPHSDGRPKTADRFLAVAGAGTGAVDVAVAGAGTGAVAVFNDLIYSSHTFTESMDFFASALTGSISMTSVRVTLGTSAGNLHSLGFFTPSFAS